MVRFAYPASAHHGSKRLTSSTRNIEAVGEKIMAFVGAVAAASWLHEQLKMISRYSTFLLADIPPKILRNPVMRFFVENSSHLLAAATHLRGVRGGVRGAMASYWVSQERYFCKYCKVWLSNHQAVSDVVRCPIIRNSITTVSIVLKHHKWRLEALPSHQTRQQCKCA